MTSLSRKDTLKKVLLSLAFVALSLTAVFVYASEWPYPPADTLDPGCNPGDVDCNVNPLWIKNKTDNFLTNIIDDVGIGTATPAARLHVDGDGNPNTNVNALLLTVDSHEFMRVGKDIGIRFFDEYSFPNSDGTVDQVLTTDGVGGLTWKTPSGGGGSNYQLYAENEVSANSPQVTGVNAVAIGYDATASGLRSVALGQTSTSSGDYSFSFGGIGNLASGDFSVSGGVQNTAQSLYETVLGAYGTNYAPEGGTVDLDNGDRLFNIGNGTTIFNRSDALTILKNGDIGVGIDNFETNTNGNVFQVGDGSTGIIAYVDSGTGAWVPVSDERKKQNIKEIGYSLDTVLKLRPVSFEYKRNGEHTIGFIAQEVKDVVPESVFGSEKEGYGMSYTNLVPVLTKAVQELNAKVDLLSASSGLSTDTLLTTVSELISKAISDMKDVTLQSIDSVNGVFEKITTNLLSSKKVETSELCVDDVCVTRDQFKKMVEKSLQEEPVSENVADPVVDPVDAREDNPRDLNLDENPIPDPSPTPNTVSS